MIRQLVFLDEAPSWLRLEGDSVVARGAGWPVADAPVIAVVPGEAVVLHWVELPPLAPAQALAAARLLAADVSAAPLEQLHVALGAVEADGRRPLALVDRTLMADWLARAALAGINPAALVPLPLLLPLPAEGVTLLDDDGVWTVRGAGLAFAAEAGQAAMMLGDTPRQTIAKADFVTGLGGRLAALPLDLRQGDFAERPSSRLDARRVRRLALLAGAALLLWLANDVAGLLRNNLAADRAEAELADAARAALPRGTALSDPRAQVAARLARLGGGGFAG
ncbi:MAG: general secretion pathway protein GspL, partial [Alphaproteobacteria bacterium PA4]